MISDDINEPIIFSSKPSAISFYLTLLLPALLIGFGVYAYFEDGEFLVLLAGLAILSANWLLRFKEENYITGKAIYKRVGSAAYDTFLFSDLSYTWFADDTVYLMFGVDGAKVYSISNDARHYDEIRNYLEQVSQKHLPHHRYEFAFRSELSSTDKLGCLECQSIFGYLRVYQWKTEKTKWSFLKIRKPEIAVCPSCKKEGRVIVSRTGHITTQGLKSLNDLSKHSGDAIRA